MTILPGKYKETFILINTHPNNAVIYNTTLSLSYYYYSRELCKQTRYDGRRRGV